jgi:sulfite reductase alpha subunit-like flavoprotein
MKVRQALKDSLLKFGGCEDEASAEKYLQKMELAGRYQTETWS